MNILKRLKRLVSCIALFVMCAYMIIKMLCDMAKNPLRLHGFYE